MNFTKFSNCQLPLFRDIVLFLLTALWLHPHSLQAASEKDAVVVVDLWNQLIFEPPTLGVSAVIKDFNAQHPTIHVRILDVPQMEQKILTAVAGRVPPDLAIFDRFRIAGYAERGAFYPLEEMAAKAGIKKEDFFEAPWNENVYKGSLYGVPFNTDVRVLYYNKQLFREAGLDPEKPPRTWKELREYSELLTKRDANGNLVQAGFVPYINFGNTWLCLYGWQRGAEYLSDDGRTSQLDDPRLLEALRWVRDFVDFYGVRDITNFAAGFATKEQDPFLVGRLAMQGEEVFMLSRIQRYAPDLDFGMASLPWPEDGEHATWSGGFSLVIPSGAEHPEAAMEVIKYMTSEEGAATFGTIAAQLPGNKLAAEAPYYADDPHWQVFVREMEFSKHRPVTPAGAVMWDEMARAWEYGAGGAMTPEDALKRADAQTQSELDRIYTKYDYPLVNWTTVTIIAVLLIGGFLSWRGWLSYKKVRALSLHRREAMAGYLFAAPVMLGLILFWVGPIVMAGVYSFCNYDVLSPARWSGINNYWKLFFGDHLFWKSLWNTLFFTVLAVPSSLIGSLALALLLNAKIRGQSYWRTLFYLPSIVPLVAMSLLFMWLFNYQYGLFNLLFDAVGIPRVPWMNDAAFAKPSLVLMNMWTVGAGMIIFLAGLQGVPRHLHESALIDGAGAIQRFVHVTIPLLSPTIFFMLIINTIGAFQVFTQAFLMTGGTGQPQDSTLFYVFYLYRQGFEYFNMGYASAMAWILFLIILAITIFQFIGAKRWVYQEGA